MAHACDDTTHTHIYMNTHRTPKTLAFKVDSDPTQLFGRGDFDIYVLRQGKPQQSIFFKNFFVCLNTFF